MGNSNQRPAQVASPPPGPLPKPESAKAEAQKEPEKRVVAEVRARRRRGFYRAGRFWPGEYTKVYEGELTAEQLAALKAEKALDFRAL